MIAPLLGIVATICLPQQAQSAGDAVKVDAPKAGYDVRTDSELDKPITLTATYSEAEDVMKSISKQTGADIEATGPLAASNLTLFVKDKPCNVILADIATVLGDNGPNTPGFATWLGPDLLKTRKTPI